MRVRDWIRLLPVFGRCLLRLPASHLLYLAGQFRNENPHRHGGKLFINTFFPPYPSKAFDRFLDAVICRNRIPFSTYFAVTDACPYNCRHCSYGRHKSGRLSTEDAARVVEQIKKLGACTIGFTGGEPLLRDDIARLVRIVGDDAASIIFTTGFSLDDDKAAELKDAGLDSLMIGMEAADAKGHDTVRGVAGSFERAMEAIGISQKAGLYTAISTVATREKISSGEIGKLAGLAEENGVHEFRILEPVPTGSFHDCADEILTDEESRQLSELHKNWNRRNGDTAISSFSYLESGEMFGCGAGFHHLFIDALGNVCPCDLTPLSFGNAVSEPLEDIWRQMGAFFGLPRSECLMKEVCGKSNCLANAAEFPLSPQESQRLCSTLGKQELPKVYRNLFKGRKPSYQPLNRP